MGCICGTFGGGVCLSLEGLKKQQQCTKCSTKADCTGDARGCIRGYCGTCMARASVETIRSCRPKSKSIPKNARKGCANTNTPDCKTGCVCSAEVGTHCVDKGKFRDKIRAACKSCANHRDCPSSLCGDDKKCDDCAFSAALDGMSDCHRVHILNRAPNAAAPDASVAENPAAINSTSENAPAGNPAGEDSFGDNPTATTSPDAPCIATSWLSERGLMHAAIRHSGAENVLCVPGLPCGTSGHLLRECINESSGCRLVTYREVCERPGRNCIRSTTAVSQLSHTYEWSKFSVVSVADGTSLQLTSLSAHPLSGASSPTRLIAYVADHLNSRGLGFICNAFSLLLHRSRGTFERRLMTWSSCAASLL